MGSRGMDPSRVKFDPAAVARHSSKVEVDSRYRAEGNVVIRKKRPALDDLVTGLKELPDKKETKPTNTTTKTSATKRAFTDVYTPNNTASEVFSLPSFKKQKTTPDPSESRNGSKPTNQKTTTTTTTSTTQSKISASSKSPSSKLASSTSKSTSSSTFTSKLTSSSTTSTQHRQASNGLVAKPSYASVTSKPSPSTSKPLTNGTKASLSSTTPKGIAVNKQLGSGSKPVPPGSKTLAKPQAPGSKSFAPKPPASSSKPPLGSSKLNAKSAPSRLPLKSSITTAPTRSGFPVNSRTSTVKPGQPRSTLQTLPNRPTGPPGSSKLPLRNGKQKPRRMEYNEYEYDPIADKEELGEEESYWNSNYSSVIQDLFRRKHKYPPARYNEVDEEEVRETGFLDWEAEEEISEAVGEREDKAEFISEKKRKLAKQKKLQPKTNL